jgi:hypothetical protein
MRPFIEQTIRDSYAMGAHVAPSGLPLRSIHLRRTTRSHGLTRTRARARARARRCASAPSSPCRRTVRRSTATRRGRFGSSRRSQPVRCNTKANRNPQTLLWLLGSCCRFCNFDGLCAVTFVCAQWARVAGVCVGCIPVLFDESQVLPFSDILRSCARAHVCVPACVCVCHDQICAGMRSSL